MKSQRSMSEGAGRSTRARRGAMAPALPLLVAALAWTLAGCAASGRSPADQLVDRGDYDAAILAYQADEARTPDAPEVQRNYGIALFFAGRRDEAIARLERAKELDPNDARTLYFLGRAAEETGRTDLALASYTGYLARTKRDAKPVRAKVQELAVRQATADVASALAREKELDARMVPENTVAVPEFENALRDQELDVLRYGLASVMITDLGKVESLRVLERQHLSVLLSELALASPASSQPSSADPEFAPIETVKGTKQRLAVLLQPGTGTAYYGGPADDARDAKFKDAVKAFQRDQGLGVDGVPGKKTWAALDKAVREVMAEASAQPDRIPTMVEKARVTKETAPRVGTLLGARRFVQGTFAPVGDDEIQLGASLLEITTGGVQPAGSPVVGKTESVLRLEKDLVFEVLGALGVEATPEERREIEKLPTNSFLAFMAYSRGLYLEDLGRSEDALGAYLDALRADPGFTAAKDKEALMTVTPDDEVQLDRSEVQESLGRGSVDTADRLTRTATWNGIGPGPEQDRGDETDPSITDTGKVGVGTTIIIEGDLPGGTR
ncbi:MAG: peptidoglycan-binding protein [Candidatus Eisenbacteria bacterium]